MMVDYEVACFYSQNLMTVLSRPYTCNLSTCGTGCWCFRSFNCLWS